MQIRKLEIRNFLSYETASLDLKDRGLVLIEGINLDQGGSNGSGKTSILSAIEWVLFGRCANGATGDAVVRNGQADTRVTVELEINNRIVKITRYRKHRQYKNAIMFFISQKDCRGASDRETQKKINAFITLDWNTFTNVVMFPQAAQGIASLTDADQKSILDNLLAFDRFQVAREKAKGLYEESKKRHDELSEETNILKATISACKDTIKNLAKQESEWMVEKKEKGISLEAFIKHHQNQKPKPPDKEKEEKREVRLKIDTAAQPGLYENIETFRTQLDRIRLKIARLEQQIHATDTTIRGLHEDLKYRDSLLEEQKECSVCGQDLPEEAKQKALEHYLQQQQKTTAAIAEAQNRKAELNKDLIVSEALADKIVSDIKELEKDKVEVTPLWERINELEAEIQQRYKENDIWTETLQNAQAQLERCQHAKSPYQAILQDECVKRDLLKARKAVVTRELTPLKDDLKYIEFWTHGYGNQGVKSLLLSTVTPFLNEQANKYLSELSNNTAKIQITTQKQLNSGEYRDKLDFKVSFAGSPDNYTSKSGGERRRTDIAIMFALGDLASTRARTPVKLRLLDEPFENLDGPGAEQVVQLLKKYILPKVGTILVITHNPRLAQLFETKITVTKLNGISYIRET